MPRWMTLGLALILAGFLSCSDTTPDTPTTTDAPADSADAAKASGATSRPSTPMKSDNDWADGDTIPSGSPNIPPIKILKVHKNGSGPACGTGKTAKLKYKAMLASGSVLDPGNRPFEFVVGAGRAIKGWDIIVARMRVGDSFTLLLPQDLAYGSSRGDLKFDMELLSFH